MSDPIEKPFFAYRSFRKEFDAMKAFASIGVRQFCVFAGHSANSLGEPYCEYEPTWKWFDAYDFSPLDEQVQDVLNICPDAQLLCLIDLNSPLWLARQLHVDSYSYLSNALCDEKWRTETEKYLDAVIAHMEKNYGNRIAAYVLMCGKTDEWMDHANGMETLSKAELFRKWCVEHHYPVPEDVPSLRQCFDTPCENGAMRDPQKNRNAVLYWKFHSDLIANSIIRFARRAREQLSVRRKIGVFYGYVLELGMSAVLRGHLAYEKVESSDAVDFVISPGSYRDRMMGGGSGFMTPNSTVHLHGKDCLYEIDHRTHSANMRLTPYVELKWYTRWADLAEDRAGLRREFCRTLFHGASLWWFDMWGKFYADPENIAVIKSCCELWLKYARRDFEPEADVMLVVDPEQLLYYNPTGPYAALLHPLQSALNRLGSPHRICTLNDIPRFSSLPRLLIFAGMSVITPEKKALLEKYVFGRTTCFWYGPSGLNNGTAWENMDLPGMRFPEFEKITAETLRDSARQAGVHIYADQPCLVWAGRNLLAVHTGTGGTIRFSLKQKAGQISELFSGTKINCGGSGFSYTFASPETALFLLEPEQETE